MKKVNIMLITVAILAIGGGTLAFKASTKIGIRACYTTNVPGHPPVYRACPSTIINSTTQQPAGITTIYGTFLLEGDEKTCPEIEDDCYPIKLVSE